MLFRSMSTSARRGYLALGEVLIVLRSPGSYSFDPALYGVREGTLVARVDGDEIDFIALTAEENRRFLGALATVSAVAAAASAPAVTHRIIDGAIVE